MRRLLGIVFTDIRPLLRFGADVQTRDDLAEISTAKWLLGRDRLSDWPILATARAYDAHLWIKDRDFS
ncbi:MAG: hypothetical protein FJX59_14340 [Alphaproteobacteria bacterium]|nr:hypothetical protein [Alphaproteobacteria bacterium]